MVLMHRASQVGDQGETEGCGARSRYRFHKGSCLIPKPAGRGQIGYIIVGSEKSKDTFRMHTCSRAAARTRCLTGHAGAPRSGKADRLRSLTAHFDGYDQPSSHFVFANSSVLISQGSRARRGMLSPNAQLLAMSRNVPRC